MDRIETEKQLEDEFDRVIGRTIKAVPDEKIREIFEKVLKHYARPKK